jgi:phage FluMu protein Com
MKNAVLEQIRQRRKAFWIWPPLVVLVDFLIIELFKSLVGEPPQWLFNVLNIVMVIVGSILLLRLSEVRCPHCGKPALRAGMFFTSLDKLRCCHCDHPLGRPEGV